MWSWTAAFSNGRALHTRTTPSTTLSLASPNKHTISGDLKKARKNLDLPTSAINLCIIRKLRSDTERKGFNIGGLGKGQRLVFAAVHVSVKAKGARCRCHPKQTLTTIRAKIRSAIACRYFYVPGAKTSKIAGLEAELVGLICSCRHHRDPETFLFRWRWVCS